MPTERPRDLLVADGRQAVSGYLARKRGAARRLFHWLEHWGPFGVDPWPIEFRREDEANALGLPAGDQ